MATLRTWLLLVYSVPRDPSASRVYILRKLKRLGTVMIQDAVWVLPATPKTREHFQWLAAEIKELHGEATLWESQLTMLAQEKEIIRRFEAGLDLPYRQILRRLKGRKPDLVDLSRRYQQIHTQDYFNSELGNKVRAALVAAREGEP